MYVVIKNPRNRAFYLVNSMAQFFGVVILLLAVNVESISPNVRKLSSELYIDKSSSSSEVSETNRRLTNSKTLESNIDFPCNEDRCQSAKNGLPLAYDYAGSRTAEKTPTQRNRGSESLFKEAVIEEDENNPSRLPRIDPIEVGYVRELNLVPGKVHKMRTLSLRPALFEIEDFLTAQECDDIIFMAQSQGLTRSQTLGEQIPVGEEGSANRTAERLMPEDPADTFQQLDANCDGHLDLGEIARGLMELGRILINDEDAKNMMSDLNMDRNQDGVIAYNEFIKLVTEKKMKDIVYYLEKIHKTKQNKRTRDSSTTFLDPYEHIDFKPLFESLAERIQLVTKLPKYMIWSSENMQVIRYKKGQHYHCHYDSEDEEVKEAPCCHHAENFAEDDNDDYIRCVPCRYLTFFYYLNEPQLGGETAFPIADNDTIPDYNDKPTVSLSTILMKGDINKCDLSDHCYDANLYYKPKRGAALFWYNHYVSEKTGWLGPLDSMSYHGGCDVIEGTKWAANNWINAGIDRETDLKLWEESRLAEEDFLERMRRHPWEEETREEASTGSSINNDNNEQPVVN